MDTAPLVGRVPTGPAGRAPRCRSLRRSTVGTRLVIVGAALLIAAISGCSVGPEFVKPDASGNTDWSQTSDHRLTPQEPSDTGWWKCFNDPTLDQLIDLAYHQNLQLQFAGLKIMESRAQLGIAVGRQRPQVQLAFASATG